MLSKDVPPDHPLIRRAGKLLLLPLFPLLLLIPESGHAQEEGTEWMGIRGSRLGFAKGQVVQNYGLELRFYVKNNFALNYSLTFGADQNQQFYMHSYLGGGGAGVLGGLALAASDSSGEGGKATLLGIGALISLFVPEGVSYSIPVSNRMSITPYLDPLGFDIYNGHLENDLFVSGKVGARLKYYITNKLVAQPYGGIEALYYKGFPIASEFGLALSYRVGKGKKD